MARIRICKEPNCKNTATSAGYCRLHYLKNWKKLKREEQTKAARRLNRYVEHMIERHPDRYVEAIKGELKNPRFEKYIEDRFGDEEDESNLFNDPAYDEEIRELIEKLKKYSD